MVRAVELGVAGLGGVLALAQVPGVPQDFQSWPVQAILGFLMLALLAVLVLVFRCTYKAMADSAAALAKMAEAQSEANRRSDEMAGKLGETNRMIGDLVTEFRVRPCMAEKKGK